MGDRPKLRNVGQTRRAREEEEGVREDFAETPLIALDEQIGEARHLFEKSGKDLPVFRHPGGRIKWITDGESGRIVAKRVSWGS